MHDEGVKVYHEIPAAYDDWDNEKKFGYEYLREIRNDNREFRLCPLYNIDESVDDQSYIGELLELAWCHKCVADAYDAIRQLMECGSDIATPGNNGMTPLHVACRNGASRIIRLLIKHGANPTAQTTFGETPLDEAVKRGHMAVGELLDRAAASNALSGEAAAVFVEHSSRQPSKRAVEIVYEEGRKVHDRTLALFVKEYAECFDHECLRRRLESNDAHAELRKLHNLGADRLEVGVVPMQGFSSMEQQQQHYTTGLLALTVDDDHNCARSAVGQLMECSADIVAPLKGRMTPVHVACRNGALRVVCLLLDHGADAEVLTEDGDSTLFIAAQYGHGDIVEVLAQRGVAVDGVNSFGMSPLHAAAENGHAAVVGLLLRLQPTSDINLRTHIGWTPLHCAAWHGNSDVVRLLIEHGGDINAVTKDGMTPLHVAAANGSGDNNDLYELLISNNINAAADDGATPLFTAVMHWRSRTVSALAKRGASIDLPNALGVTPLHAAALEGDTGCIWVLTHNGANVNAANVLGETPLHAAAKNGYTNGYDWAAEVLVMLGADISAATTDGETPLFVAAAHGRAECIGVLAGRRTPKSVVNVPAKGGVTPLLIAAQNDHLEVVKELLDCDADVYARADDGRTPISAACVPEGGVVWALRFGGVAQERKLARSVQGVSDVC